MDMKMYGFIGLVFILFVSGCVAETPADTTGDAMEDDHPHDGDIEDNHPHDDVMDDSAMNDSGDAMDDTTEEDSTEGAMENATGTTVTVEFTNEGYVPKNVEIQVGDTVKYVNRTDALMWPATAMHPTHTVYPGSDIAKCGTEEESTLFDACQGIGNGGEYSFTFLEMGTWNYHDHLNPSHWGSVSVGNATTEDGTMTDDAADNAMTEDTGADDAVVEDTTTDDAVVEDAIVSTEHAITISDAGFTPATLTIAVGDTVTWTNSVTARSWPASDPHPVHTDYPEKGGCFDSLFDACGEISIDGTFSFAFNEVGSWGYHDHKFPSRKGTIIVE